MTWKWLLLVPLVSCHKNTSEGNKEGNNGCITRRVPQVTDTLLDHADEARCTALFEANNIPTDNYQFTKLSSVVDGGNLYQGVSGNVFINGLPAYAQPMGLDFQNGFLYQTSPVAYTTFDDTIPVHTLDFVRDAYFQTVVRYKAKAQFQDSCLVATLSYILTSVFTRPAVDNQMTRVWVVTCMSGAYTVLVDDDTGAAVILTIQPPGAP
jgi:hypothetical protein